MNLSQTQIFLLENVKNEKGSSRYYFTQAFRSRTNRNKSNPFIGSKPEKEFTGLIFPG